MENSNRLAVKHRATARIMHRWLSTRPRRQRQIKLHVQGTPRIHILAKTVQISRLKSYKRVAYRATTRPSSATPWSNRNSSGSRRGISWRHWSLSGKRLRRGAILHRQTYWVTRRATWSLIQQCTASLGWIRRRRAALKCSARASGNTISHSRTRKGTFAACCRSRPSHLSR